MGSIASVKIYKNWDDMDQQLLKLIRVLSQESERLKSPHNTQ